MVSTIRFGRVGETAVLVCGRRAPSNDDWTAWSEYYAAVGLNHRVRRLFVVSAGGGPNARQRAEVIAKLAQTLGSSAAEEIYTAACGASASVRIISAALAWLSGARHMKVFGDDERERALEYLNVPSTQRAELLLLAKRFESELAEKRSGVAQDV